MYLLILFLSIATPFVYNYYYYFDDDESANHSNKMYYKCKTKNIKKLEKSVYNELNYARTFDIEEADIWMPCGYGSIERQLKDLNVSNAKTKIYGIDGCDRIVGKTSLWNILKNEYSRQSAADLMPTTYVFKHNEFDLLMDEYEENNLYILKSRKQGKKGLKLTRNASYILSDAQSDGYLLAQKYLTNLYLLNERKINLRIYWLLICRNDRIEAYLSKFGKNIYTNKRFDAENISEFEAHITSVNLSADIYKSLPLNMEDLSLFLGRANYKKVRNGIVDISKKIFSASKHFVCNLDNFDKNTRFQYFGADYIFDTDFKPYLLEINKSPALKTINAQDRKMKKMLIRSVMKIVHDENARQNAYNHGFELLM